MTSQANLPHFSLLLGRGLEKANLTTFENSKKINENSCKDNFFAVVKRKTRRFTEAKKKIWYVTVFASSCTLYIC